MHAGAADQAAVNESALRLCFLVGRLAEGSGLQLGLVGEQIFADDFFFVMDEVGLGEVRTLLENDNAESVGGKLFGEDAAGSSGTDDDEINFVGSFVFGK